MTPLNEEFILIVDDNANNLAVLSSMLKASGYAVRLAVDGESALQQMTKGLPSLIFLDVMMPGIDGFETCRRLKANSATAEIPVIFMTALTDEANKVKGLSMGAVDYITKPFAEAEALARVRLHLRLQTLLQTLKSQNNQLNQEIEQRQQAEQQLQQLNNTLEQHVQAVSVELQGAQLSLIQKEKMASLGSLVAGVAHEINNPIGFLNGSIGNAKAYLEELLEHLALYQKHISPLPETVQAHAEEIDIDFLVEDFPKLLDSMTVANKRIKTISNSLRVFSRADAEHKTAANLHEGLESTLLILKYRLKATENRPAIAVLKKYDEGLPDVDCFPGKLNQVFMNILANAVDIFDEVAEHISYEQAIAASQAITVTTRQLDSDWIEICIGDNGKGMAAAVKDKVLDHLFTTKRANKGTGLWLAISKQIVVDTHGGQLDVESAPNEGTQFRIRLPLADR